jgi:RHS repeat-associated protein
VQTNTYESATQYIAVTQSYDALGRLAQTTNPSRQTPGDGLGFATTYGYDSLGRQLSITTPNSLAATTSYSGNRATATHQAGSQRASVTDALGRLTDVYENPAGNKFRTSYVVGPLNQVRTVAQGGETRSFVYDSFSRLTSATNPESGVASYSYDGVGNVLSRTDARNVVTCFGNLSGSACTGSSYDGVNRPGSVSYSDGTPAVTYVYDGVANGIGQLTSVSNLNSTTSFTAFDAMGRVRASTQQTNGQSYVFSYTYNLAGSLLSETYPSKRVLTTAYDAANRPMTLGGGPSGQDTTYVKQAVYWPNGGISSLARGNGLVHSEAYSNRLQTTSMLEQAGNGTQPLNLGLNWANPNTGKNNGTLQSVAANHNGLAFTQAFGYDALNRLVAATETSGTAQTWAQTYGYDQYGNMWMPSSSLINSGGAIPTANVYNGKNQNPNFSYDAAENQTAVSGLNLTYDAQNRQVGATNVNGTGGTATCQYDGAGQRVTKALPSGMTVYVYDAFGALAAEYGSASVAAPCTTCYLAWDHLGSVRLVTDGSTNANVIGRHDFAPFGQEIQAGVGGRSAVWSASDSVSQRFTGQEWDGETNLDFFQARYMASGLGRFMSADPGNAGAYPSEPQSWNGYGYVGGNPVVFTDPSGMNWFSGIWDTISSWFGCPVTFCGGTTEKAPVDTYSWGTGGGWLTTGNGGLSGPNGGGGNGGGSGIPIYTVTGTGVANRNPQPVSTPSTATLQTPGTSGNCPAVPRGPGKDILVANINLAEQASQIFSSLPNGDLIKTRWYYDNVRTGGPMDYKNQPTFRAHPEYDEFGQFNFGAVGAALSLPEQFIKQAAGIASFSSFLRKGKLPPKSFGLPWTGPPYGDQPWAQPQIGAGYRFTFIYHAGGC